MSAQTENTAKTSAIFQKGAVFSASEESLLSIVALMRGTLLNKAKIFKARHNRQMTHYNTIASLS
jgi:hypothetical protein